MADQTIDLTKRLPRGAIPSPRSALAAARPHIPDPSIAVPPSFLVWPVQMSSWNNYVYGDCVSAEEAFAKATAAPQTFIPEATVVAWASANGYLNGAYLTDVMTTMQTNGFPLNGATYCDGPYNSVDWTNAAVLQSAIYSFGPVKIGVGAGDFQSNANGLVTPGTSGWAMYNYPKNESEDHCVSLCGYGTFAELVSLFQQHNVTVHAPNGMPTGLCYAMFTWNSIGIIDEQSMLNMTYEAWIRNPVTIVKDPNVYLTTQGSDGIWTFDQTSPTRPTEIGSTAGLGFTGVIMVGNILYLTTHGSDGIWTFDLTTLAKPVQIPSTAGLGFVGIIAIGNTVYLTTQGSDGIWTFDLTTKAKPVQIPSTAGLGFTGIIAIGNTVYLTTHGSDGIWTFDLTTKAKPAQIGSTAGLGFTGIIAIGNTVYLTTHGSDGIWMFDLTTKAKPAQIGSTAGLGFTGIIAAGNTIYLTTHGSDGIWTFDLTTKARPAQIGSTAGLGFVGILFIREGLSISGLKLANPVMRTGS
jgi:hypothetical protein